MKSSRDSRFLKKVLTAAETESVRKADDPAAALWSFWAAKEAAYKIIKKINNGASFLPRRWEVFLRPAARRYFDGEVALGGKFKVFIRLFLHEEFLHCLAADGAGALDEIIYAHSIFPDEKDIAAEGASSYLRDFAARKIAEHLSLNASAVRIERNIVEGEPGPPRLYLVDDASFGDISLSHDGRFVAFAFLP